jgi:hypothetical protein
LTKLWALLRPHIIDEGTKKTPIPEGRLHWFFCFVGFESGQKRETPAEYGIQHNSTPPPPPPQPHTTVCIYCTFALGRGGGVGEVREKVERQQFTRGVEKTNMTDIIASL